ncbi:putative quinol monooxygenase [uncultured Amnibacterium sp.]|uniref:putative quinol monooxygenase n=1 Tax=uncultured Amnibacterium sp. TaxID=1631851 RepID=UPI0035CB0E49
MYAMRVSMDIKPGRMTEAVRLMGSIMERVRNEDGCLAFDVGTSTESNTMFIYESFVNKAYHDDVHESYPEVIELLGSINDFVEGPMSIETMQLRYSRDSGAKLLGPGE